MLRPRRRLHGKTRVDPQEVEVHRQRVGKTHVEPQEVEEPSTHDDPVDDVSMDGDDTLRCDQCEQLFGTIDIHCQVGRRIKWGKFNISRVTERKKATSRQCYPCLRWQRHKKFRTLAKAVSWLFPKGKKHDDRWTKMMGLMPRPPGDNPQNKHSNGRVINQPDALEFWVPLNHTKV